MQKAYIVLLVANSKAPYKLITTIEWKNSGMRGNHLST